MKKSNMDTGTRPEKVVREKNVTITPGIFNALCSAVTAATSHSHQCAILCSVRPTLAILAVFGHHAGEPETKTTRAWTSDFDFGQRLQVCLICSSLCGHLRPCPLWWSSPPPCPVINTRHTCCNQRSTIPVGRLGSRTVRTR